MIAVCLYYCGVPEIRIQLNKVSLYTAVIAYIQNKSQCITHQLVILVHRGSLHAAVGYEEGGSTGSGAS